MAVFGLIHSLTHIYMNLTSLNWLRTEETCTTTGWLKYNKTMGKHVLTIKVNNTFWHCCTPIFFTPILIQYVSCGNNDWITDHQSEVVWRVIHPARLSVALLIHPDIRSKVNCAQTSQTALSPTPGLDRLWLVGPVSNRRRCVQLWTFLSCRRARKGIKKKKKKVRDRKWEKVRTTDKMSQGDGAREKKDGVKWPTLQHKTHIPAKYNCGSLWLAL